MIDLQMTESFFKQLFMDGLETIAFGHLGGVNIQVRDLDHCVCLDTVLHVKPLVGNVRHVIPPANFKLPVFALQVTEESFERRNQAFAVDG